MTEIPLAPETLAWFRGDELRARIFLEKYALQDDTGVPQERTPEDMWRRVAQAIASVEGTPELRARWTQEFLWLLWDFRFIPGGRILHGAGNPRKVTLLNCYVLPIQDDSLEGIFTAAREAALTYARGGGVGIDVSPLRPRGAPVHNAARTSTGAVSFMELFSLTTGLIGQSGRRGALMLTIADHHPDVLEFCRVKRNLDRIRYANISVRVSDALMRAVEEDGTWRLHYENPAVGITVTQEIPARVLWQELTQGARDWAEPGVLFWDTVERMSTSQYGGMAVNTTNPCSEQALEPYGCCNLGSLNLLAFVKQAFAEGPPETNVNWPMLRRAVRVGVRFLDNVLDYNRGRHALPQQEEAALRGRRIGLGITALGDLLAALRLRYDSEEALDLATRVMAVIQREAYQASLELAREKGPFPAFDAGAHLAQPFLQTLPPELQEAIGRDGLRNVALLTIPPVGTGAALAGVTSGIEPIFALTYTRRSESLSQETFPVLHPLVARYVQEVLHRNPEEISPDRFRELLPDFFITAHELEPLQRVQMQAALQAFVDNAISSTINLPRDTTPEEVDRLYRDAWRLGCKGITVYREGSREGVLLTPEEAKRRHTVSALVEQRSEKPVLQPRPSLLTGITLPQQTPEGNIQVTINEIINEGNREPFEVLCHAGKAGSDILAYSQALARAASILLRLQRLPSPRERLRLLIDQWADIGGSRSIGFGPGRVRSGPDGIAQALGRYLDLTRVESRPEGTLPPPPRGLRSEGPEGNGNVCPQCRRFTLVVDQGCLRCRSCPFKEC